MRVPFEAASVGVARRAFLQWLRGVPGITVDATEVALLVLSELATNAIRHASPLGDGTVALGCRVVAERLQLTVTDGGAASSPRAVRASGLSLGGRGLAIVEHLTRRWSTEARADGVTVTAEIDLES